VLDYSSYFRKPHAFMDYFNTCNANRVHRIITAPEHLHGGYSHAVTSIHLARCIQILHQSGTRLGLLTVRTARGCNGFVHFAGLEVSGGFQQPVKACRPLLSKNNNNDNKNVSLKGSRGDE